jgi:hypothetical protein
MENTASLGGKRKPLKGKSKEEKLLEFRRIRAQQDSEFLASSIADREKAAASSERKSKDERMEEFRSLLQIIQIQLGYRSIISQQRSGNSSHLRSHTPS